MACSSKIVVDSFGTAWHLPSCKVTANSRDIYIYIYKLRTAFYYDLVCIFGLVLRMICGILINYILFKNIEVMMCSFVYENSVERINELMSVV
jgi:hypothetical protein